MAILYRVTEWVRAKWRPIILIGLIVGFGGYYLFGRSAGFGATLTIHPGAFTQTVNISGTVVASQSAALGFSANGRIAATYVTVGQHVEAGQLLAETENGDLAAALSEAKANLASLQAGSRPEQVSVASTSVANAELTLVTAIQSAYTAADAAVHNTIDAFFINPRTSPKISFIVTNTVLGRTVEQDRAAIESVLGDWATAVNTVTSDTAADVAAVSATNLARVVTLLSDANAALNQATPDALTSAAMLSSYVTTVSAARTTVNTALTALTADSAALNSAKRNLALVVAGPTNDALAAQAALVQSASAALQKTRITAPFSGLVTQMDAKVGETVSPSESDISLQSDGLFEVETYVPEVSIASVSVGNTCTVSLDAYGPSVTFPAKVVSVDPAETVKDGVPTYKTTLAFLSKDARIRSGMTANVSIETATLPHSIVIPAGAIGADASRNNQPYVSVVVDGKVEKRTVSVASTPPALGQALIESGLSDGDVILLAPAP